MVGTFGGALEARQIDASNSRLTADVTGEVERDEGVLGHPQNSRGNATDGAGRSARGGRACAWDVCDALPALSHAAQHNPSDILV